MTTILTNQNKIAIIESHMTNIAQNKYNSELALIEENARLNKEESVIAKLQQTVSDSESQIAALQAEKDKLN